MSTSTEAAPAVAVQRFSASEPGAWSNSYLLSDDHEALLFDVFQLRSDAKKLADAVDASGKRLTKVWISHAHPDHFLQLDLIVDHFPEVEVLTTPRHVQPARILPVPVPGHLDGPSRNVTRSRRVLAFRPHRGRCSLACIATSSPARRARMVLV